MTIGQPPGVTGNAGTLTRALRLTGDGFEHRRLRAAGLLRRGLDGSYVALRAGLPAEAVEGVMAAVAARRARP